MAFWSGEIKELDTLYQSFRGDLPDIVKELEQLIKTDDPNVVMLYSRRCLEVIITDLCETELHRPRKTEPLKGIIDKLNSEEKVPAHIITSMHSLNTMANFGAHPKDFDPEQVRPVLNNLAIIIKWYLKYKDFHVVSKPAAEEPLTEPAVQYQPAVKTDAVNPGRKAFIPVVAASFMIVMALAVLLILRGKKEDVSSPPVDPTREAISDSRDRQVYSKIKIGNQEWLGENLRAVSLTDGTPVKLIRDKDMWAAALEPAYCYYENNSKNRYSYGLLYNWFAVNTGKLCPDGWHVPTKKEWETLTATAGDSVMWLTAGDSMKINKEIAGLKLKESGNAHWSYCDSIKSTDDFRFCALPGGERTVYGVFWGIIEHGAWWSSDEDSYEKTDAYNVEMDHNKPNVTHIQQYKKFGMSVRCLKNN